jgi:hypothetical protein
MCQKYPVLCQVRDVWPVRDYISQYLASVCSSSRYALSWPRAKRWRPVDMCDAPITSDNNKRSRSEGDASDACSSKTQRLAVTDRQPVVDDSVIDLTLSPSIAELIVRPVISTPHLQLVRAIRHSQDSRHVSETASKIPPQLPDRLPLPEEVPLQMSLRTFRGQLFDENHTASTEKTSKAAHDGLQSRTVENADCIDSMLNSQTKSLGHLRPVVRALGISNEVCDTRK